MSLNERQLKPSAITHPQTAARALIQNKNGDVLMVYLEQADVWDLPGGRLDYKEKIEDAVIRELYEETGIVASIDKFAFSYEHWVERLDWHLVHMVFHVTSEDYSIKEEWVDHDHADISGGVSKARFIPLSELKEMNNAFPICLAEHLEQDEIVPFFKSYL